MTANVSHLGNKYATPVALVLKKIFKHILQTILVVFTFTNDMIYILVNNEL